MFFGGLGLGGPKLQCSGAGGFNGNFYDLGALDLEALDWGALDVRALDLRALDLRALDLRALGGLDYGGVGGYNWHFSD